MKNFQFSLLRFWDEYYEVVNHDITLILSILFTEILENQLVALGLDPLTFNSLY